MNMGQDNDMKILTVWKRLLIAVIGTLSTTRLQIDIDDDRLPIVVCVMSGVVGQRESED